MSTLTSLSPSLPPSPGWGGMSTLAGVLLDTYGIGSAYALNLLFMLPCAYLSLHLWRPKAKADEGLLNEAAGAGERPAGEAQPLLVLIKTHPSVSDLMREVEMAAINDSVLRQVPKAAVASHDSGGGFGGVSGRELRDSGGEASSRATHGSGGCISSSVDFLPPEKHLHDLHHYEPHLVHRR